MTWSVRERRAQGELVSLDVVDGAGNPVCGVTLRPTEKRGEEFFIARAHRIAAVEDLFTVARRVLDREDKGYTLKPDDADALRAAIAKAEGRS